MTREPSPRMLIALLALLGVDLIVIVAFVAATAAELASRLDYGDLREPCRESRSEAAFSRAFKRVVGVPPGAVRRGLTAAA